MAECKHETISRADYVFNDTRPFWKCDRCNHEFMPAEMVTALADVRAEDGLDKMAGVLTAVLWDFHTRAVEHYGDRVAAAVTDNLPCSTTGVHTFVDGRCQDCGTSQFLGG